MDNEHWEAHIQRQSRLKRVRERIETTYVDSSHAFFTARQLTFRERPSLMALLKRPEVRLEDLIREGVLETEPLGREDIASIETDIKYEGYVRQQTREIEKLRKAEARRLPEDLDYASLPVGCRGRLLKSCCGCGRNRSLRPAGYLESHRQRYLFFSFTSRCVVGARIRKLSPKVSYREILDSEARSAHLELSLCRSRKACPVLRRTHPLERKNQFNRSVRSRASKASRY